MIPRDPSPTTLSGHPWHQQFQKLVLLSTDPLVNSIHKILTVNTDAPLWTPANATTTPAHYNHLPQALTKTELLSHARQEFQWYLYQRWLATHKLIYQQHHPQTDDEKRFAQIQAEKAADERFREDRDNAKLHELDPRIKPLPILRGDDVAVDLGRRAVRALPWLLKQERQIQHDIAHYPRWKLLEDPDLDQFIANVVTQLRFPPPATDGKLSTHWIKELEQALPKNIDHVSDETDRIAIRVAPVISLLIEQEWENYQGTFKATLERIVHFTAQQFAILLHGYHLAQHEESKVEPMTNEEPLEQGPPLRIGQVRELVQKLDLVARKLGFLAAVCKELDWLFRPLHPPPHWPLESRKPIDRSNRQEASIAQSLIHLRDKEYPILTCAYQLVAQQDLALAIRQQTERLAVKHLQPACQYYRQHWEKGCLAIRQLTEEYSRVHALTIEMTDYLLQQTHPVTPKMIHLAFTDKFPETLQPDCSVTSRLQLPDKNMFNQPPRQVVQQVYQFLQASPPFNQFISLWIASLPARQSK